MPLKLTSNVGRPELDKVGSLYLDSGRIHIQIEPNCQGNITRNGKTISLNKISNDKTKISGVPQVGDIYTIEFGLEKLIVQVEEEKELPPDNIYIKENTFSEQGNQSRKTTLTVGAILLILLIISVVFGVKQKNIKEFEAKSSEKLSIAIQNYETAINGATEKEEARLLFVASKKIVEELNSSGYKNEKLNELSQNISRTEADVLGEVKVEVKEYLDLTLQTSGFNGSSMVSSGEEIFIFDSNNKNIINVGIKNKSAKIAANKDTIGDTVSIGSYEDRLFLNKTDGIYEVDTTAKKVIERDWNDTNLIYFYAANAYLIDKDLGEVYRFSGSNNSFSSKSEWLAPGIEMDFSKVVDLTIDGSIWIITSSGKVTKLTNGNPQAISLKGIVENLSNPNAIYTNETQKNVYILEKDKGRIVVIDKTGEFKLQYVAEEIKNALDLVVSEEEGKVILLNNSSLNYIEI